MCLGNLKTKEEVRKIKKGLPRTFTVYKIMQVLLKGFVPEYWQKGEPKLIQKRVYKARVYSSNRSGLRSYAPGFHAFFDKGAAEKCCAIRQTQYHGYIVKEYHVRRSWLTAVGYDWWTHKSCGVFSHIEGI